MDNQAFQARRIIETLRAGVPSRDVSGILLEGRETLLSHCQSELEQGASDLKPRHTIVWAPYGGGKSHFLSALANLAIERNFAVSQLVLSKETPFNRINKVYEAAAHSIELPGYPRQGFEEALMKIRSESDEYYSIRDYLEHNLHPKILFVFQNYFREGDAGRRTQLYEDLAGTSLTMANLRAIHRANFSDALRMPRQFLIQTDTPDYFRFLSSLVRILGFRGWVILLDEAELISKLGIGSRAQAYLNLGILLGLNSDQRIDGLFTACAFASAFLEENLLLGERGDLQRVPLWLKDPRRNRVEDSLIVDRVLRSLNESQNYLPTINMEMARKILETIRSLHGSGYDWQPKLDTEYILQLTATQLSQGSVRTAVRAGIEYLDVAYQYNHVPAELAIGKPDEGNLSEDSDFFSEE